MWIAAQGFGNNTIAYNRIFNVMTVLNDGGGVCRGISAGSGPLPTYLCASPDVAGIYVNGATNGSWINTMSNNWVNNDEHV